MLAWLLAMTVLLAPRTGLAASGPSSQIPPATIRIAVAPIPGAPEGYTRQIRAALDAALGDAHFLTGRITVKLLDQPISPTNLGDPKQAEHLLQVSDGATLLIWGKTNPTGQIELFLLHLYALDPVYQSRQAAGLRPIVPLVHRLPTFQADDPLRTVYALLGISYNHLRRYDAARQVLDALNNFPDLSAVERFPVVFFIALADLSRGLERHNPEQVDRALYHFGALKSVMRSSGNPQLIGATLLNRGVAFSLHPTRHGPTMLNKGIDSFEQALRLYPTAHSPIVHARILHLIATAEQRHPPDRDGYHLHRALAAYRKTLRTWTPERFPEAYRNTLHNMALCYQRLPVGNRQDNLGSAITLYRKALKIPELQHRPSLLAATWGNLGQVYQSLPITPDGRSLYLAISAYREALRYWDRERDPEQFSRLNLLAGQAFQAIKAGNRHENLIRALQHYDQALTVITVTSNPSRFAVIQLKRGVALASIGGPRRHLALTRAREAFILALRYLDPDQLSSVGEMVRGNLRQVEAQLSQLTTTPAPRSPPILDQGVNNGG